MEESTFRRHLNAMLDAEVIAVDTETTGLNVKDGRDYCMGISVAYRLGPFGVMSAYFPFRHQTDNMDREWLHALESVLDSKPLVFHNLKFDLHSLNTIGLNPTGKLYDTLNIAHMLDEEMPSKALDYLGQKFLGQGKEKSDDLDGWIKAFGWGTVPPGLMEPYACRDAELTLRLFELLWPKMKEQELHVLWPTERRFTRLLTDMERRGVRVNREFCDFKARQGRDRMAAILDELDLEEDTLGPKALYRILITELGLPVLATSEATGKPSFTKKEMERYDELLQALDTNTARLVLEYRGWQKAVTSLYEPMLALSSPDGRVRCNFKQHGTRTGRLACAEPNLQQIPRQSDKVWNGDAKQAFDSTPGFELYGWDYSQLEFRLAAAYGNESWLLEAFNDPNVDVFTAMVDRIGAERFICKTYTYATMYGAGKGKIANTLGREVSQIEDTYNAFRESIAGIRQISDLAASKAKSQGYVRYWTGRRRHFPYPEGYHKAFNSLLQGGGAELVKRAMIAIDDNVCDENCRIVLQVHDEIVFEIREGMREHYEPLIVKYMTDFPEFDVRLAVEGKVWNK